ncbi:MAG: hypothetical protein K9M96_09565, partial [Deltaproteobacteria bacterium]|nr:hypothetical protein [Deltaproteobacteria bacterium]
DALPRANVLQSLTDITGGWKDHCTYHDDCMYRDVDGLAYLSEVDKIVWNLNDWYNVGAYDQDSLGWSDLNLTGARGVWHIGPRGDDRFHNAKACNYLFTAPQGFADTYLGGKSLIAGNTREAGANGGSQGPTLYALAPWEDGTPPDTGQELNALCLLYYREIYACVWEGEEDINEIPAPGECDFPGYRAFDHWNGGAWIEAGGTSAIVIVGRKGLGPNCYGTQAACSGDPCDMYKGYHAYPYDPRILFYDPNDIIEVLQGTRDPWTILPKETHTLQDIVLDPSCAEPGAAAYDPERNILYITEQEAGPNGDTVVHVWKVRQGPVLDIKANGSDKAVFASSADPVSIKITLTPGTRAGESADWWIGAETPFAPPRDRCTYVYPVGWRWGLHPCIQTGLFGVTAFEVLNTTLPTGEYTFYFALDDPDGEITGPWWRIDSVQVRVRGMAEERRVP